MLPMYRTFMARHGTDIANTVIVLCLRGKMRVFREMEGFLSKTKWPQASLVGGGGFAIATHQILYRCPLKKCDSVGDISSNEYFS